ncbi:16S rRNA (adenine(1518)-N(6)/adenine(1519)-N(6))-dimethyltransferase RsmA [Phenylobacterium montanum]|uniref:Ribosomal RNA small subunit methyltransferase A n=1 Tax=Phenylobacterium montanum TaxID=2823693 RepID=A0A975IVM3_9CAUL|nr:16S rRNA (adenine(1518)-N(6)/adenine(1519)-N(6))-dimethyltransferase RsmA [Caulobacter sp. S6]QUD88998.1 16S rRNA (adenine(1518)-N(6)/adenine(1519)-N(6))-dimethyltransferase RsmA [Caulobacter sp. S6]
MSLADLPPLRESLEAHGLFAKKAFGQHFLLDLNITRKIARLAAPLEDVQVIEVGPGPGGLTRALLEAGARVTAVEKDARFLPLLQELAEAADGRLTLIEADALTVDEDALAGGGPFKVISNLPYNVGTPLLIKWLSRPEPPAQMALMFQREVAQRIVARVGEEAYGRLAVISQAVCEAALVMDLPARAFTPPPKVASAVVRLEPRAERPAPALLASLERITAAAFGQRRKMLRSSLKALGGETLCEAAGIAADRRAETIPVSGFLDLAQALLQRD